MPVGSAQQTIETTWLVQRTAGWLKSVNLLITEVLSPGDPKNILTLSV